jgi:chromosome segregation ATPase
MRQFKNLLLVVLLMTTIPCFADEPNTPVNADFRQFEARLKALEEKIVDLENRIAELETRRPPSPPRNLNPSPSTKDDPNKDALRIERSKKAIKEANDLITLNETRLNNLPRHLSSLEDHLNLVMDELELLGEIDKSYKTIMQYAEKNPELGIDRMKITKKLIELKGKIKTAENEKDDLKAGFYRTHQIFTRSRGY